MNTIYQPTPVSNDAITFTAVEENEKRPLSDAASALMALHVWTVKNTTIFSNVLGRCFIDH